MPNLTSESQESVRIALGYRPESLGGQPLPNLQADLPASYIDRIGIILRDLQEIEDQFKAIRIESAAIKLDNLEMDYRQHFQHLNLEKQNLLNELSLILSIPRLNAPKTRSLSVLHYQ